MNPLPNAEKFIKDTLRASTALKALVGDPTRVFSARPPQAAVFPCVVYNLHTSSGSSALGPNDSRVAELLTYMVKAVTVGESYGEAHEIANAFDEALRIASGPVTFSSRTVEVQGVRKEGPWIEYQEEGPDGVRYNHVGATFRLFVSGGL
jgi:hypothetical protein